MLSIDQLQKEEAKKPGLYPPGQQPNSTGQREQTGLASYLESSWQAAVDAKRPIETRLFDCLKRRKGDYDPAKLAKIKKFGSVESYIKYTGMKVRAAKSWIPDVILPAGEKPWGLDPSPVPELPESANKGILDDITGRILRIAEGYGQMPTSEEVRIRVEESRQEIQQEKMSEAKKRAKGMEKVIEDQFMEGGQEPALESFIDDLTTFPSAILKGPTMKRKPMLNWDGDIAAIEEKIIPCDDRVSPFDFYPSPECGRVGDGYMFERRRITKKELQSFIGRPGYNESEILAAMQDNQGVGSALDIDVNDTERAYLENKDPRYVVAGTADDRIPILEFWGSVDGESLNRWGLQVPDNDKQYDITAIKVGMHIIKATRNPDPLGNWPYYVASYEVVPDSIWGTSIPELISPIQDGINMTVRAMFDNIALAAGPQVTIDTSRLDPRQKASATKVHPRKVWLTKSSPMGSTTPPIHFEQPKLIAPHLLRVLDALEQMGDDQSGIPAYTYGNQTGGGAGDTASGLSMLMDAASKGIRLVIANVGKGVIKPRVIKQFIYNMLYHPDPSIKGDVVANVRGTLAEIMKARQNQERMQFMQAFVDPAMVTALLTKEGIMKLLRKTTDSLDIPGLIPTEEEMKQISEGEANAPVMPQGQQAQPGGANTPAAPLSPQAPPLPPQRATG